MESRTTARILTYLILLALIGFVAIQFLRPHFMGTIQP
jgi:hypothetical protein